MLPTVATHPESPTNLWPTALHPFPTPPLATSAKHDGTYTHPLDASQQVPQSRSFYEYCSLHCSIQAESNQSKVSVTSGIYKRISNTTVIQLYVVCMITEGSHPPVIARNVLGVVGGGGGCRAARAWSRRCIGARKGMLWGCWNVYDVGLRGRNAAMPLAAVRRCGVPTLDGEGRAPQCGAPVHGHGAVAFGGPFCGLLTSAREVRVGCGDGAPHCVCRYLVRRERESGHRRWGTRASTARQSLAVTRASSTWASTLPVCVWASTLPVWLRIWARRVCG
jgi:hypothetical protein